MKFYFADTSALAKRYVPEIGSSWVRSWIVPAAGNVTAISELCRSEMASLLARREREKSLSQTLRDKLFADFLTHTDKEYLVLFLETDVLAYVPDLLFKHPLRTLDAIQLASALAVGRLFSESLIFVSADRNLLKVAAAEGLSIDNPLDHP